MNPTMQYVRGVPVDESFFNNWWPTRRGILFTQLQGEGFWPATTAPVFVPHGGSVASGTVVSLTNPNAGGILYFTTNGEEADLRTRLKAPARNTGQDLMVSAELRTGNIMVKDEDVCLHCGLCAERCPTGAWDMQKFLLTTTKAGPACRNPEKSPRALETA